jgi:hypothetical protein
MRRFVIGAVIAAAVILLVCCALAWTVPLEAP